MQKGLEMLSVGTTSTAGSSAKSSDLLNSRTIKHVVVLGANGAMGLGSGALFTSDVPRVTFLARTKEKAEGGLAAATKMVRSSTVAKRVDTGSYAEDFDRTVAEADLIFEAVTEQLDLKREFFDRIDKVRRPDSIVATVTSGLSINLLAEGRSESFRKNFLGLHFFNPPNVIVGTELVAGKDTDPKLVDFIEAYCTKRLGRAMVRTATRKQRDRYGEGRWNGTLSPSEVRTHLTYSPTVERSLHTQLRRRTLSDRASNGIRTVARTIADLADRDTVEERDLLEAIALRASAGVFDR